MEKISFVIPVYNSENTIREVVKKIEENVQSLSIQYDFEIILINDSSSDNSEKICKNIAINSKKIIFINLTKNFGQHNALMAGFQFVSGDLIMCLDDDLQTPPEEMSKLISTLKNEDYDAVYAKYEHKHHSLYRNIGSKFNDVIATRLIQKPKDIYVSSFFIVKRYIVDGIIQYTNPFPYIPGLIFRITKNVGQVTVDHKKRLHGKSNYTFKKLISLWINGFTNFSVKPLRISSILGISISSLSFILIFIIIIQKIINPNVEQGWTSLMVGVFFIGGIQLITLGLLGEYIGRIFLSINKSPQFMIKEVYNYEEMKKI